MSHNLEFCPPEGLGVRCGSKSDSMRTHPLGSAAQIIGTVTDKHPGMLEAKTGIDPDADWRAVTEDLPGFGTLPLWREL